jgi:hypothetical protein
VRRNLSSRRARLNWWACVAPHHDGGALGHPQIALASLTVSRASVGCAIAFSCTVVSTATAGASASATSDQTTSGAHLAGAMGKPVWILLPYNSIGLTIGSDDSPWYPRENLFRQQQIEDWAGVISQVKTALQSVAPPVQDRPAHPHPRKDEDEKSTGSPMRCHFLDTGAWRSPRRPGPCPDLLTHFAFSDFDPT